VLTLAAPPGVPRHNFFFFDFGISGGRHVLADILLVIWSGVEFVVLFWPEIYWIRLKS